MALTKQSDNNIVYVEAKHYCLWRRLKKRVSGCDEVDHNNPSTATRVKKCGYGYNAVTDHAANLIKTTRKRITPSITFGSSHLVEGEDTYVL